ncbi:MAG: TonB C-terminal domain-containing protein, partial [Candidatus Obscuribacterales bacterium]|nr:TonB C-terminal domain-containing protein [Candidatus Obscuribacterales bacterium]
SKHLCQANGLTIDGLRQQIEGRLDGIWSSVPTGPAGGNLLTEVDFTIVGTGSLAGLKINKSSGNEGFDHACIGTIKRMIPLPPLPPDLEVSSMALRASFMAGPQKKVLLSFAPLANLSALKTPANTAVNKSTQTPAQTPAQIPSQMPAQASPQPSIQSKPGAAKTNSPEGVAARKKVNQAVVAISDNNYKVAIAKLEEALSIDPQYQLARDNLAIAYNNYGLELRSRPEQALAVFHKALALDPDNDKTRTNLEATIKSLGKNPQSFEDRVYLADKAVEVGDIQAARIEYSAALAIKNDQTVADKLNRLLNPQMQAPQNPGVAVQRQQAKVETKAITPDKTKEPAKKVRPQSKPTTNPTTNPTTTQAPAQSKPQKTPDSVNQKLDTVYKHLSELEKKHFQKSFESDDIMTRLNRLDNKVFGKAQPGNPRRRLDGLLLMQ